MQNIYREIFWGTTKYVVLRNIFMVITGVISIFIVRLLGPSEYGKYSLVWNLISTVGPILSLGWLNTLARFIPEKFTLKEKSQLLSQSLISVFIAGIVFFVVINLIYKFLPHLLPKEVKDIIFVFSFFTILVSFFNIFEGFWRGLGKFNEFVIIDGLRSNIGNLLGLGLLIYGFISYTTIIKVNFFLSIFFVFILFFFVRNYLILRFSVPDKQVITLCATLFIGQITNMLSNNIDILLLRGILKDPQQVGYYFAGVRIPKIIETMFIAQLPAPFLYYFSSPNTKLLKEKILVNSSKMLGFIFGIVGLLCFSFASEILLFLFGDRYIESINAFKFFSLSLPMLAFVILSSPFYISENKPVVVLIVNSFIMILFYNFTNFLLLPKLKFFALIVSYLMFLNIFVMLICVISYLKFKVRLIDKFFILFCFIFISCLIEIFLRVKVSFLIFLCLCLFTKFVTTKEFMKFVDILQRKYENT